MRHLLAVFTLFAVCAHAIAADPSVDSLDRGFRDTVRPFLEAHCLGCHGAVKPKAGLDLSGYTSTILVARDHRRWQLVAEYLHAEAMPPAKAKSHPTATARQQVLDWLRAARHFEATRTADDPGLVPSRRLSNAEYDLTIRDLTGVDLRPTREFPVDPANEAGFDNSAESLTTSPALVAKYLTASRQVAEHAVLTLDGIAFADHPAVTDTDRDKYCVRRVIDFYKRQPTDLAAYFLAAWRYKHRTAPSATLADVAAESKVSAKYLTTVWTVLTEKTDAVGPIAALQAIWKELPNDPTAARAECERMRDFVIDLRAQLVPEVKNLTAPGIHNGSQCFVLWKNRQFAANRTRYLGGAFAVRASGLPSGSAAAKAMIVPADEAAADRYEATFHRFCATFPDAFYVSERARVYLDPAKEKQLGGRLLSAGFHSMTGFFRDDGPLCEMILDAPERKELDRLWREFDCVTGAPMRQHSSFIWFERTDSPWMRSPEFDFARAEDKDAISAAKIRKLAEVYTAKAAHAGASDIALAAIQQHFSDINANIRRVEADRRAAEPKHVTAVQSFAERAYRRPLTTTERDSVTTFYRTLRDRDGLTHEEAIRDSLASVLMSPHFLFRTDLVAGGSGVVPLSDYALANRLSYFLWASMPDPELLARAAAGDLHTPEVLAAQARRMLRDDRARGLATEFGGNWLDFRRFEEHNAVDRERFPAFDTELRQAMFEEPVRFLLDLVQREGSVLDLLYAKHTFVNPTLARHYGMPPPTDGWVRVNDARPFGRGGLLPMAVFLTKNAPGLRTSPVKRGYWVVRRLLGEAIPPPPADVPELPADESKLGAATLRETLAVHRDHASCAGCHNRIDAIGLAFEAFGPVGERRTVDLGGRTVDTAATFPDGGAGVGIDGLRTYLRDRRQDEFLDNLCRKLLGYALGRSLLPADDLLVDDMRAKLSANGYRFGTLVETIVTSPQFRTVRGDGSK